MILKTIRTLAWWQSRLCPCPLTTCLFSILYSSYLYGCVSLLGQGPHLQHLSPQCYTNRQEALHKCFVELNKVNMYLDQNQKLFILWEKGSTSEGSMAAKLASTGNGSNPMALVTSCGMSRENKVEFSEIRHTHGIQHSGNHPGRSSLWFEDSAQNAPDRTQHQRPFFQGGGTSPSESQQPSIPWPPFGKRSWGIKRKGPLQQDGTGRAGERPQLSPPLPPG